MIYVIDGLVCEEYGFVIRCDKNSDERTLAHGPSPALNDEACFSLVFHSFLRKKKSANEVWHCLTACQVTTPLRPGTEQVTTAATWDQVGCIYLSWMFCTSTHARVEKPMIAGSRTRC